MKKKRESKDAVILGIDPGFARLGYALVVESGRALRLLAASCVETPSGTSPAERLATIAAAIERVIRTHHPSVVAMEQLFFSTNQKTAIRVAEVRGVILLLAAKNGLPVFECTPLELKAALTGYGAAPKAQVQEMVKLLLRLPAVPKPDDVADAIAVALTCAASAKMRTAEQRRA
ncbi:MAG: crossover junction endodeoxyribonuclease RuvC [Parcubacteria group bacterium]|nr:crossover junction endodeoxyribonuclease RuvC [Parcubacteria group bacterium]